MRSFGPLTRLVLIVVGSVAASSFLFMKILVEEISPSEIVAGRVFFGAIALFTVIRIQKTPASFPFKEAWKSAWTVITLKPTDDVTHLSITSNGYGTDDESVAMRRFFEAGNQQTLETLRRHFGAPAQ